MKLFALKIIKKYILTLAPIFNKLSKNHLPINNFDNKMPFILNNYSTYINYILDTEQQSNIQNYINNYSNDLKLIPINMFENEKPEYLITVNFYNCSSPLFFNDNDEITRCEINTYIKDISNNNYGTLILDYNSNYLSLDPINLLKRKNLLEYSKTNKMIELYTNSSENLFDFQINFKNFYKKKISNEFIDFTKNIYYKNGVYDKIYHDYTLSETFINVQLTNIIGDFKYNHMIFNNIHSVFYFPNKIIFYCKLWDNLDTLIS